ncbi:hypothetical protein [Aestuariirhabdus sp. LZHN29]|uniref:hypothetical protein n=1 Tax=Aestuariirhabdus sp. LZHN29 TaxID=3417462 RepID=UPI003CF48CD0
MSGIFAGQWVGRHWFTLWVAALAAIFLTVAVTNLIAGYHAANIPHVVTRYEGFVYDGIIGLLRGEDLYPAWHEQLYRYHVYNPLTYLPSAWLANSPDEALLIGRLISWGAAIALAGLIAWWTYRVSGAVTAGVVFGLFFTVFGLVAPDFFRLRPESLAMLIGFFGWCLVAVEKRISLSVVALCCVAAFAVKQSYVLLPAVIFCGLCAQRRWSDALRFSLYMAAGLSVLYLAMWGIWGGASFQHTLLAMGSNELTPVDHFGYYAPMLFQRYPGFWLAAIVAAFWAVGARSAPTLLRISLPLSLVWTFIIAGKAGASDSYFGELLVLLLFALGFAMGSAPRGVKLVILCVLSVQAWQSGKVWIEQGATVVAQYEDRGMPVRQYADHYRESAGPILLVDERLSIQSQRVVAFDWFLLDILQRSGRIKLEPLFEKILGGEYSLIVFDQTAETPLERHLYQLTRRGPYRRTASNQYISEWTKIPVALNNQ